MKLVRLPTRHGDPTTIYAVRLWYYQTPNFHMHAKRLRINAYG